MINVYIFFCLFLIHSSVFVMQVPGAGSDRILSFYMKNVPEESNYCYKGINNLPSKIEIPEEILKNCTLLESSLKFPSEKVKGIE